MRAQDERRQTQHRRVARRAERLAGLDLLRLVDGHVVHVGPVL